MSEHDEALARDLYTVRSDGSHSVHCPLVPAVLITDSPERHALNLALYGISGLRVPEGGEHE